jgi:hypothetical protein
MFPTHAPSFAPTSEPTTAPTTTPTIWAEFGSGVDGQEAFDNSDIPPAAASAGYALGAIAIALIVIAAVVAAIVAAVLLTTGAAIIAKKTMHKIDRQDITGEIVTAKALPMGEEFVPDEEWVAQRMSMIGGENPMNNAPDGIQMATMNVGVNPMQQNFDISGASFGRGSIFGQGADVGDLALADGE